MKATKGSNRDVKRRHRRWLRAGGRTLCRVYVLLDPTTHRARYIGQTRILLRHRLKWHMKDSIQGTSRVSQWIRSLDAPPRIESLDENATWDVSEIIWIERFRNQGFELLNVLRGGSDTLAAVKREGIIP